MPRKFLLEKILLISILKYFLSVSECFSNTIVFLLVLLSMCIYWTPLGYDYIEGVQGRYFIPIVFTLLIVLNNKKVAIREHVYRYVNIFACILTAITVINLLNACFMQGGIAV